MTMHDYDTRLATTTCDAIDELTPARVARLRRLRRRLAWHRRGVMVAARTALPGAMLLALVAVASVPLPVKAAALGSGWAAHVSVAGAMTATAGATATISPRDYATARIAFSGRLLPDARRSIVTITLRQAGLSGDTTVGTVMLRAERVFNTSPTLLPALFAEMGVTPHPTTRYTLTISASGATLTSATVTLTR